MREIVVESLGSPLTAAATICRMLSYTAALLASGGMLFMAVLHDRRAEERSPLARAVTAAAAVAAVATLAGVALQGVLLTGRTTALIDPSVLTAVLESSYGTSAIVRALALAALSVAVAALWRAWAVALGLGAAVVVAGSFLLTGHALQAQPGWLAVASGLTHTVAAAAWFGGLALLGITMRLRRGSAQTAATAGLVARFSAMATVAVVVVSIAGAARVRTVTPVDVGALRSGYGATLAAKVLLVAVIFVVAGYNHRYLVPAIRRDAHGAERRLRTTVRLEAFALVVVIAASAVLANLAPPGPPPAAALRNQPDAAAQAGDR